MTVTTDAIKQLREATGAGVMDAKRALEESGGDMAKAKAWVSKKGLARAEKKKGRETSAGSVFSYVHHNGRVGSLVSLACETDFVAKTDDFQTLGKELAMQVASSDPSDVAALMEQSYNRDPSKTIEQLVSETAGILGENIRILSFGRQEI